MPDPLARHRTRQVVDASFGDGVGGVGLGLVDDVAGHRGREDDGGGGEVAGDDVSVGLAHVNSRNLDIDGRGRGRGRAGLEMGKRMAPSDSPSNEERAVDVDVEDAAP